MKDIDRNINSYLYYVSTPTRIQFAHEKPSSQKFHLNSTLELF